MVKAAYLVLAAASLVMRDIGIALWPGDRELFVFCLLCICLFFGIHMGYLTLARHFQDGKVMKTTFPSPRLTP